MTPDHKIISELIYILERYHDFPITEIMDRIDEIKEYLKEQK